MDKKSLNKHLMIVIFCIILLTLLMVSVSADVGNTFSGGGGSSSSSSSSSGSYSSGSSGLGGMLFFLDGPLGIVVVILFIVYMIYSKHQTSQADYIPTVQPGTFKVAHIDEDSVISQIKKVDPTFSPQEFKTYVSESFLTLQEAWEKKNWSICRPIESNSLFQVHKRQLDEFIQNQITNHMDRQNIHNIQIASFKQEGNYDVICVKLDASVLDYVTRDSDQVLIEGSNTVLQNRSYRLEFIRTSGNKTEVSTQSKVTNCPNCGAPMEVSASGECAYCHSIITNGDFGWVVNAYAAW